MNYYTDVLKKYVVFEGRARRKEYWMFVLFSFIISIVLSIVFGAISAATQSSIINFIPWIYSLGVLLPTLGVAVRRLHDTGRRGFWLFIGAIPIIGAIVLLVFFVQNSQPGDNQYGANPKGV